MRSRREDRGLLDGEDFFDEDDEDVLAMRAYRDFNSRSVTPNSAVMARPVEQLPGSGRDVMGGFVDPFARHVRTSGEGRAEEIMHGSTGGAGMFPRSGHAVDRTPAMLTSTTYSGLPLQREITDTSSLLNNSLRYEGESAP